MELEVQMNFWVKGITCLPHNIWSYYSTTVKNWADIKHVFLIGINKDKYPGTMILKVVA